MSFMRKDNFLDLLRQISIESHFSLTPIHKSDLNHHLTALQVSQHHEQQKKWMYHQQRVS